VRPTHLPVAPPALPVAASSPSLPPRGGWQTPYRNPGPSRSVIRIFVMIAITSVGLALYWYFFVTNYGGLEIVPDVTDAEVHIRQNGQLKHTSVTDRQFTVRPGTYELVLIRPKAGYKLSRTEVEVGRGRVEQVR